MFGGRQDKEERKEQKRLVEEQAAQLRERHAELKRARSALETRLAKREQGRAEAVEAHRQTSAPKWQYREVDTKQYDLRPGWLDRFGAAGWEMVGLTTFTERRTWGDTVEGTIYTRYVFKRPIPSSQPPGMERFSDVDRITREMVATDGEMALVSVQYQEIAGRELKD